MKKATIIVPENYDELIKMKHYLIGLDKPYKTVPVPVSDTEKLPMIMTEMDFMEKVMFKLAFRLRSERVSVFG